MTRSGLIRSSNEMKTVKLGRTGIEVSRLGMGTGTQHPSGHCAQALMDRNELAGLLLYSFSCGINFWDTAFQYVTYPHIAEALKQVRREEIVLATKLTTANEEETTRQFHVTLSTLGVNFIDICLLHGVRTKTELQRRSGAFNALLKIKKMGKGRAIGISSHGLSALKSVLQIPEIDVVWARINYAGIDMDIESLSSYDRLASIPLLKKSVQLLPESLLSLLRSEAETEVASADQREEVAGTLQAIHSQGKGIVGMKVLARGRLSDDVQRAIGYVRDLPFVDAVVIGMLSKREIEENCKLIQGAGSVT